MSTYIIGDIHGCYPELCQLLSKVDFDEKKDQLWLTGDLVARGLYSLDVLLYIKSLGKSVRLVLGNHDLHLLAIYAGIKKPKPKDNLTNLLQSDHLHDLITWLRYQPLFQVDHSKKLVMTHAGITPQWDLYTAKSCAKELQKILSSNDYILFLKDMYGDMPNTWQSDLIGIPRLRFHANVLTRMRFCLPNGALDLICNTQPNFAPIPLKPWFALPRQLDNNYTILFGHWASLQGVKTPDKIIALDTGCCWGGYLTLLHWETKKYYTQKKINTN